jgi:hypothetical protein
METRIEISELKSEDSNLVKQLAEFIKNKTRAEVETETSEIVVKGEEKQISRAYTRLLLKKFLHQQDLKEYFRVRGGRENTLIVKAVKVSEEEEE